MINFCLFMEVRIERDHDSCPWHWLGYAVIRARKHDVLNVRIFRRSRRKEAGL